jgi:hypothetical protein
MEENPYAAPQPKRAAPIPRWRLVHSWALFISGVGIGLFVIVILAANILPGVVPLDSPIRGLVIFTPFAVVSILFIVTSKNLVEVEEPLEDS